ncbi:hypothetical protein REPUB_Repub09cG0115000 [Reevesia pubescens]
MTAVSVSHRMNRTSPPHGLTYATFSDGYDQGFNDNTDDPNNYMVEMKRLWFSNLKRSASILNIYYHYFGSYGDIIENGINDPSFGMKLPGLPLLARHDLPSFFIPPNPFASALPTYKEHKEILDQETNPRVLFNTFDALEA